MEPAGSHAALGFSYPYGFSRNCSVGYFCRLWKKHTTPASYSSSRHCSRCAKRQFAFRRHLDPARRTNWIVYSKRPFAGALQVLDYVGRYTHRVAISNNRLFDIEDGQVRFRWKDYHAGSQQKIMTLAADEFIRRFLIHVPPHGFQRIRYYGLFGNRYRNEKLARCRELLGMTKPEPPPTKTDNDTDYREKVEHLTGVDLWECPACRLGRMVCIDVLRPITPVPSIIDTS